MSRYFYTRPAAFVLPLVLAGGTLKPIVQPLRPATPGATGSGASRTVSQGRRHLARAMAQAPVSLPDATPGNPGTVHDVKFMNLALSLSARVPELSEGATFLVAGGLLIFASWCLRRIFG